jgi:lipid-A-disaccharide synthase
MINVPFVGMPNLIAGREIAPEMLQETLTADRLATRILALLDDPARLDEMRRDLAQVRDRLGAANASERAARRILTILNEKR